MSGDGYRPGRIVTEREDEVYLACHEGHEFFVGLLHPTGKDLEIKRCPFCGSDKLEEV